MLLVLVVLLVVLVVMVQVLVVLVLVDQQRLRMTPGLIGRKGRWMR